MVDYETDIQVRFRDLDPMGHVNNAVFATYLEFARVSYLREEGLTGSSDVGAVLAHQSVDYERPIEFGDSVTVTLEVGDLGETSIPMDYEILVDDDRAATAESVLVLWDSGAGAPRPIPDAWRDRITGG